MSLVASTGPSRGRSQRSLPVSVGTTFRTDMNVPLSTFPQSPLLQTGAFAVPQTATPQAAVTSSFLAQLQMTTPASSQLVSPLTTGALIFETPARTTLPSPPVSSPLPTFTTPRAEGLG
jgi:hypothetical protein